MIPQEIRRVMILVKGYLVGGSVRDMLMGKEPGDYDIATPFTPEEVTKILHKNKIKTYNVGKEFGTVGALIPPYKVEITTFRKEAYDFVSRKPKVVFGTSLIEDLKRRDFTINALALSPDGKVIDICGGIEDLKNGIIRFVGNPKERILEDPLRILRAFRFAAKYNFKIDENSQQAIKKYVGEMSRLSKERIHQELLKAASTNNFRLYCELNMKFGAFAYYGPTWKEIMHLMPKVKHSIGFGHYGESVWEHTMDVVGRMDRWHYPVRLKIAGLLHDVGKVKTYSVKDGVVHFYEHEKVGSVIAEKMLRELKASRREINYVVYMVKNHMVIGFAIDNYIKGNKRTLSRLIGKSLMYGYGELIIDLCKLYEADANKKIPKLLFEKIKEAANLHIPKMPPEKIKTIPPRERRNYLYSLLVQKIMSIL